MSSLARFAPIGAMALLAAVRLHGQAPAPGDWSVTYSISGGIAGLSRHVTVTSAGRLQVEDRATGRVDVPAAADLLMRAHDLVAAPAVAARPGPGAAAYPDAISTRLTVTVGGRPRDVEPTPEIINALTRGADTAVWQTLVGTWREAGWSYCRPAAQMGSADMDPAIEALSLNGDSSFSVRWPGGPRTTGIPHVFVPDYTGRFRADLAHGGIEFSVDEGQQPPRDFSGRGTFRFEGDRLLLRGVWFGTRQAAQKPDVCELTFEKGV